MRLPGHDTLRMILARRAILVEGPSDELIVQAAYVKHHGKMPLDDGVDVISVNSLAFPRLLAFRRVYPQPNSRLGCIRSLALATKAASQAPRRPRAQRWPKHSSRPAIVRRCATGLRRSARL